MIANQTTFGAGRFVDVTGVLPPRKRKLTEEERQARRRRAVREREEERRSLAVLNGFPPEPRIDPATLAARRAEMPEEDLRDLTARILGDPNPADRRRGDRA